MLFFLLFQDLARLRQGVLLASDKLEVSYSILTTLKYVCINGEHGDQTILFNLKNSASLEYLCYVSTKIIIFNSFSAGGGGGVSRR